MNTPKARQMEDKKTKFIGCDKCSFTPTKSTDLEDHVIAMHIFILDKKMQALLAYVFN